MQRNVGLGPANPRNKSIFLEVACKCLAGHIGKVCLSQLGAIGCLGLCKESSCMSHVTVLQLVWAASLGSLEVRITRFLKVCNDARDCCALDMQFVSNLLIRVSEALVCNSASNFGWGSVDYSVNECVQLVIGFY